jgi:hypothetical protein
VVLHAVFNSDRKKRKKYILFFSCFRLIQMWFLMPVASVYSLGGTWVVRLARECVCGLFSVSFRWGGCKGTSICFLTSPLLSHYPPHPPLSICILPIPWYHLPGPHSKPNDFCTPSPTTFQKSTHQISSTFHALLCLCLSCIGQASDALGQVCVTLQHPLPSRGYLIMGGLVLGGLVLHFSVYHL